MSGAGGEHLLNLVRTNGGATMAIGKHVSYLIWIVWYPADPDPICSPGGGGGGPLLSWGGACQMW